MRRTNKSEDSRDASSKKSKNNEFRSAGQSYAKGPRSPEDKSQKSPGTSSKPSGANKYSRDKSSRDKKEGSSTYNKKRSPYPSKGNFKPSEEGKSEGNVNSDRTTRRTPSRENRPSSSPRSNSRFKKEGTGEKRYPREGASADKDQNFSRRRPAAEYEETNSRSTRTSGGKESRPTSRPGTNTRFKSEGPPEKRNIKGASYSNDRTYSKSRPSIGEEETNARHERTYSERAYKPRFKKTDSSYDVGRKKQSAFKERKQDAEHPKIGSTGRVAKAKTDLSLAGGIRLNRYISNAGICSRREADELINAGLVSINNQIVTELGSKVQAGDVVKFNGQKLIVEPKVYLIMNKPKDAITTSEDPEGRNTVMDLFKGQLKERVYPIGRLDRNTTGVLLFTNDGELATRMMHPKHHINKVYRATLNKSLKPTDLWTLANGVMLEDGFMKPDALAQPDPKDKTIVGIEIHSGRNRIIHRMFEHLGYSVEKLDRVLYADLEKGKLKRGEWRELTEKEVASLKRLVNLSKMKS